MRGSKPMKMKNTDYRELEPSILELARSKKHACLFRSLKFLPEMELSDMKRRQSRRTPAPLLSTKNNGEVADGSGRREKVGLWRSCLRFVGLEEKEMGV